MNYSVGIDLGGTQIRAVRIDRNGQIQAHRRIATAATAGAQFVIGQIEQLIAEMVDTLDRKEIIGVGVASPGPVDLHTGVVLQAPTIAGWFNVPLKTELENRTGLHVKLHNDANAAALGEWRFGSGRGCAHFVYVTISTGIGGGVIVDNRLLLGYNNMAGEIGHMILLPDGPLCCCGNRGCWEALASGTALARSAAEALAKGQPSLIRDIAAGAPVRGAHVAAAAERGDPLALELMQREGEWIGIGVVNLLHMYSPERVVLGGGVSQNLPLLEPYIRQTIAARALPPFRHVTLIAAQLGDNAGAIGAAATLLERIEHSK
ncbi:MAG: ROK family protein [Caldilinea sp.]|nr:ROK family protein [Caldilinea sp.]MDW8440474.1 ROK family protein [Caldilineaceae bacterium]